MIGSSLAIKVGAAAIIVATLLGAGWKIGYERAEDKIGAEAAVLVLKARDERDVCKGELDKLTGANAANAIQQAEELKADKARTDRARRALESAVKDLAAIQRENVALAQLAREYLENASDACAGAPMPPDLSGMLDRLANPSRYASGAMPGDADDNRPGVQEPPAAVSGQ